MVKFNSSAKLSLVLTVAAAQLALTGCGLKNWWGEKKRPPTVISAASSSGSGCAPASQILKGTEEESSRTFECLVSQLDGVWTQIQGEKRYVLTDQELRNLVQRNVIQLPGDAAEKEKLLRKILDIKQLLGMGPYLYKDTVEDWLNFFRSKRAEARATYRRFIERDGRIAYADVALAMDLLASVLDRLNWKMNSDEMVRAIDVMMPLHDLEVHDALVPTAQFLINLVNMACPNLYPKDFWDTRQISACARAAVTHFEPGAPWFEFVLNPVYEMSPRQRTEIEESLKRLEVQLDSWFENDKLSPLETERLVEVSRRMGAAPPKGMLDALKIVRKFKGSHGHHGKSNEEFIYPEAIPFIYTNLVMKSQQDILRGLPYFLEAVKKGTCANATPDHPVTYWTECVLPAYPDPNQAPFNPFDVALRVKSLKHGQGSAPLDGRRFSRIMVFNNLSAKIIEAFDMGKCESEFSLPFLKSAVESGDSSANEGTRKCLPEGYLTLDIAKPDEGLLGLTSASVDLANTIDRFVDNIRRKLHHLPIRKADPTIDLRQWDVRGLTQLIAMSSDILVNRSPKEKNFLLGILANFTNFSPENRVILDRLSLTAILNMVDMLPEYRADYLRTDTRAATLAEPIEFSEEAETQEYLVNRVSVMRNLPYMLERNFPRTFTSCKRFGFERSCGIAFDEILGKPKKSGYITPGDLDVITILAAGMEGVIDACDRDARGAGPDYEPRLTWSLLNGDDELDCGFTKSKDVIKRLIATKIIKDADPSIGSLLDFVNSTTLTRPFGKAAMITGTTDKIVLKGLFFFLRNGATLGSMYALISDVADEKRARATPRN